MGQKETVEPVVARLGMMLEFQFRDPYWIPSFSDDAENPCSPITVIGPISSRRVRLIVRGNVSALAVLFEPAGFHQLFHVPAAPLAERGTEGHAVLGPEVSQPYERLGNEASFLRRVSMLNDFLLGQLQKSPIRPFLLRGFRPLLNGQNGGVAQVARQAGMSTRSFERKSLEYFGLAPALLSRVSRFQRALTWPRISTSHGFRLRTPRSTTSDAHGPGLRVFAGGPPTKAAESIKPHHLINF